MVMIIYQLSCSLLGETLFVLDNTLEPIYNEGLKPLITNLGPLVPESYHSYFSGASEILRALLLGLPAIVATAPFLSLILSIFLLMHLVGSISKDVKMASKAGFQEKLPKRVKRLVRTYKMYQTGCLL